MTRTSLFTDDMWARIEPLLPDRSPRRGGRWSDHRPLVEAICWRSRTGAPWRDLPKDFPSWQTVWWRFDRWAKDGTWDRVLRELQGQAHAVAELEWTVSVDSTVARAHQHAAGARKSRTGGLLRITGSRGLSRPTTRSVDPAADGAPRPISASTAEAGRSRCG